MTNLLVRLLVNTLALVAAAYTVNSLSGPIEPGQNVLAAGPIYIIGWESALAAGLIFGLVNMLIRPLAFLFTCLLQIITLGLFTLVLNALLLLLTSWFAEVFHVAFHVEGFGPAFWGALLVSIVSTVLTRVLK